MSVYIKGLEMPSCCGECRFLSEYGDYPVCIITDEQRGYNFRIRELKMPHCPLVPVPKHGDLIERDAAYDKIAEQEGGYYMDMDGVGMGLNETPTIIPAEPPEEEA